MRIGDHIHSVLANVPKREVSQYQLLIVLPSLLLATRAKVRPALANLNAPDLRSAPQARFAIPLVDLEVVLVIAAAVDPVYAGAVAANAFL